MIVICANLKSKPGKDNELIEVMKALTAAVRSSEPDTLDYLLLRSQKDPLLFTVFEKYRSPEAMKAHLFSPHFQAASKKLALILDGGLKAESFTVIE